MSATQTFKPRANSATIHARANHMQTKQASSMAKNPYFPPPSEVDPTQHDAPATPAHPDGDNRQAVQLPPQNKNNEKPSTGIPDGPKKTDPKGVLESSTPRVVDGNADDKNTDGDTGDLTSATKAAASSLIASLNAITANVDARKANGTKSAGANTPGTREVPVPALETSPQIVKNAYEKVGHLICGFEDGLACLRNITDRLEGLHIANAITKQAYELTALTAEQEAKRLELERATEIAKAAGIARAEQEAQMLPDDIREKLASVQRIHTATLLDQGVMGYNEDGSQIGPCDGQGYKYAGFLQGISDAGAMGPSIDDSAAAGGEGGDPQLPGSGGEQPSKEEIFAIIDQLVQEGQIPPEIGEQLKAKVEAEMAGQGGDDQGGDATASLPPEDAETAKAASVITARILSPVAA